MLICLRCEGIIRVRTCRPTSPLLAPGNEHEPLGVAEAKLVGVDEPVPRLSIDEPELLGVDETSFGDEFPSPPPRPPCCHGMIPRGERAHAAAAPTWRTAHDRRAAAPGA
ncbi:unnamed protein product [Closterium sp. NIES-54]